VLTTNVPNASTAQPLFSRYRTCPLQNNNPVTMNSNRLRQNQRHAFSSCRTHN
jgi:hypothetical protein